jgi:transcriptional regulatory protein AMDR
VAERRKRRRKAAVITKPARNQEALMSDDSSPLTRNAVGGDSTADASDGKSNDASHEGECELAKQHLVEFFNQDLQYNPIRARCTYVGTELSNLNYLIRERTVDHHVYHYPCSQIYVPRIFRNSQPPATPNLIPKDAFVLPPKHVADVLVADFFEHIYPAFPIIDKESFVAQLEQPHPSPSILLQQAVFLAASHVTKVHKNTHELKSAFFRRAKALMDGKYEVDRMNVAQAALLLTWFSDGGDDICANAWHWTGVASRTAIGLGMHRDVLPSKMPERDKRLWRRIWWAVLQFDCLVSLCYGRPQTM